MKGYKTSKDFKRLRELLDKGQEVIVIYPDEDIVHQMRFAWKRPGGVYYLGNGRHYATASLAEESFYSFERACKNIGIEFIEPNEEEQI